MNTLSPPTTAVGSLRAMAAIEARRMARQPLFLIGVVLSFVVLGAFLAGTSEEVVPDVLTLPVLGAFYIGLASLLAAARVTGSTDVSLEAMNTVPETEARRTLALAGVAVPPFVAGLVFSGVVVVLAQTMGVAAQEWWFATLPDWQVWSILLTCPAACVGGAMLGVLTARWLHFRGASVIVLVGLVVVSLVATIAGDDSRWRLWAPWTMFGLGEESDGRPILGAGNPAAYIGYMVALSVLALLIAMWHDSSARTPRLRMIIVGTAAVAVAMLGLAMFTGNAHSLLSDPVPARVQH